MTPPPARQRKTHHSAKRILALAGLGLVDKLKLNAKLEKKNDALDDPLDDDRFSMVTIPEEDMEKLKDWQFWKRVRDIAPVYLAVLLAPFHKKQEEAETTTKRTADADVDDRPRKKANIEDFFKDDPADWKAYSPGTNTKVTVPLIIARTDAYKKLPFSWFYHTRLKWLIENLNQLPAPVQLKGVFGDKYDSKEKVSILDLEKIRTSQRCTTLHISEHPASYVEWLSCVSNFVFVQALHDKPGSTLVNDEWTLHFGFFRTKPEADAFYNDWIKEEEELRKEKLNSKIRFDARRYEMVWSRVLIRHERNEILTLAGTSAIDAPTDD
ncbi:hypothetical protein BKA70DRAFT_1431666 [Coprinopsis sp. MPI-PUGE-AT-0042]|nr:hypothetical protein BKA70DRAFT_1431666 [Coprinopsis sp. MPI-PUGE-AT-0042]